jgi:hypothetical protein
VIVVHICETCEETRTIRTAGLCDASGHTVTRIVLKKETRRGQKGREEKWATVWTPVGPMFFEEVSV